MLFKLLTITEQRWVTPWCCCSSVHLWNTLPLHIKHHFKYNLSLMNVRQLPWSRPPARWILIFLNLEYVWLVKVSHCTSLILMIMLMFIVELWLPARFTIFILGGHCIFPLTTMIMYLQTVFQGAFPISSYSAAYCPLYNMLSSGWEHSSEPHLYSSYNCLHNLQFFHL